MIKEGESGLCQKNCGVPIPFQSNGGVPFATHRNVHALVVMCKGCPSLLEIHTICCRNIYDFLECGRENN